VMLLHFSTRFWLLVVPIKSEEVAWFPLSFQLMPPALLFGFWATAMELSQSILRVRVEKLKVES